MLAYPDILVVEDTKTHLLIAQYTIDKLGLSARYAEDGLTAMQMIEAHQPDLMLLDLWLPGASGETVLEYTQNLYGKRSVNTIITSSQTTDINHLFESYPIISQYLIKPFVRQQLIDAICTGLNIHHHIAE